MYFIDKRIIDKKCEVDGRALVILPGFSMTAKKGITICDQVILNLKVVDCRLAHPLAVKKVMSQYKKLILLLTDLLVSDDGTGDSLQEVLNQIEKFRLEIKTKYRIYLKKKELEMMSKQLISLKKEASNRLIEVQNSYFIDKKNDRRRNGKSR